MQIGVNAPPTHPNCRSTTQLILDHESTKHEEKLIENPKINEKTVKGSYNKDEVKKLREISDKFINAGYKRSGHAIQRAFERDIKPERVIDVIKTGKKYIDSNNSIGYYKNRISVHISKETGQIKTIIKYNQGDTTPLKRNRNARRNK